MEEDDYGLSSADQKESVHSNDILLYGALSGYDNSNFIRQDASAKNRQESDHEWRMANGIGKYIFYNKIIGREGRLALHPHYEALLNDILFEYWVDALDQASKQDFGSCTAVKDILIPLVDAGYDLFDLSVSAHPKAGTKVTHAYTQRYYRPLDFKANCHWFASRGAADRKAMVNNGEEPYTMGYWTDILAVYKGELMIV